MARAKLDTLERENLDFCNACLILINKNWKIKKDNLKSLAIVRRVMNKKSPYLLIFRMLIPAIDPNIIQDVVLYSTLCCYLDEFPCRGNDSAQLKLVSYFFFLKQVSSENQMSTSHQQSCLNTCFCCVNFPFSVLWRKSRNHEKDYRLYSQIIKQLLACGRTCGCHFLYHYQHKLWCVQWAYSLRV